MGTTHRRKLRHYNDSGHAHFLTFSCWNRMPLLARNRSRHWFTDSLADALEKHDFGCWSSVTMPEHVHLVVAPHQTQYSVSSFLSSLKLGLARPAVAYLKQHDAVFLNKLLDVQPSGRKTYRFWQPGGGIDVNLWTEAKVWEKVDYCHNNPLRRGLAAQPEDWEYSSYRDFAAGRTVGPIPIDWGSLPADPRKW